MTFAEEMQLAAEKLHKWALTDMTYGVTYSTVPRHILHAVADWLEATANESLTGAVPSHALTVARSILETKGEDEQTEN